MLIKFQADDEYIEALKEATGQRVASKAAVSACLSYFDQVDMIARLERQVGRLSEAVRVQQQIIDRAKDSAAALLDHVAQKELFHE